MVVSWKKRIRRWVFCLLGAVQLLGLCSCFSLDSGFRRSEDSPGVSVMFLYENESASSVCVAGDFNAWETRAHCMMKGDNGWKLGVELPSGRYCYVFVVDGDRWVPDPGALLHEENGFGGESSVLIVE